MCEICRQLNCPPRCPNYSPPRAKLYCQFCGEGIYEGEQYIVNEDGEYRHYECFYSTDDMLDWLGVQIKTMED